MDTRLKLVRISYSIKSMLKGDTMSCWENAADSSFMSETDIELQVHLLSDAFLLDNQKARDKFYQVYGKLINHMIRKKIPPGNWKDVAQEILMRAMGRGAIQWLTGVEQRRSFKSYLARIINNCIVNDLEMKYSLYSIDDIAMAELTCLSPDRFRRVEALRGREFRYDDLRDKLRKGDFSESEIRKIIRASKKESKEESVPIEETSDWDDPSLASKKMVDRNVVRRSREQQEREEELEKVRGRVIAGLLALDDKDKIIVILRDLQEWEFADIASLLSRSESAVRRAHSRAIKRMR
ncbi:MAG: RNA polymerase sigma factor [Candidatus Xenobiia bacterium LiM19]